MNTMVSSEIKDLVDMNQFEKSDVSEIVDDINIDITLSDETSIVSRATSIKVKSNKIYLNFFCNSRHVNSLLNTSDIKEIKIGTILTIQKTIILTKQFANVDSGMYQVELVVLNCNN
jgi:hypothetical protein